MSRTDGYGFGMISSGEVDQARAARAPVFFADAARSPAASAAFEEEMPIRPTALLQFMLGALEK